MERIATLSQQVAKNEVEKKDTLTITDKKGNKYEIKIVKNEFILANDLLKVGPKDEGVLRSYDPGYMNTINCVSQPVTLDLSE